MQEENIFQYARSATQAEEAFLRYFDSRWDEETAARSDVKIYQSPDDSESGQNTGIA